MIVPAILPVSRKDLEDKLGRLSGLCTEVQIDIVDGKFAGPATWPYLEGERALSDMQAKGELLPHADEFHIEIDLMSADPESVAGTWIGLGATRLTIHAESTRYLSRLIESTRTQYGYAKDFAPGLLSIGLALNTETDVALIEPFIGNLDYVQFMGIRKIGVQGSPFDPTTVARIHAFHKRYPHLALQVDGGVSRTNAAALLDAGASRLIVGSDLWHAENLSAEFRALNEITEAHGLYNN